MCECVCVQGKMGKNQTNLEHNDQFQDSTDSGQTVTQDDRSEPQIEQWQYLLPLEPIVELLQEKRPHKLRKMRRLYQRSHVEDGRNGGKYSYKNIENAQTNTTILVIST